MLRFGLQRAESGSVRSLGTAGIQGKGVTFPCANAESLKYKVPLGVGDSSRDHACHPDLEDEPRVLQQTGEPGAGVSPLESHRSGCLS